MKFKIKILNSRTTSLVDTYDGHLDNTRTIVYLHVITSPKYSPK